MSLILKRWRLETYQSDDEEESFSLIPLSLDSIFNHDSAIPDLTELQEKFLKGKKELDDDIRRQGIIISHQAIVLRRKLVEES